MPVLTTRRHIAPRLASGMRRIANSNALPPHIKTALQMVAAARGESLSWTLEQVIYEHFRISPPDYVGLRTAAPVGHTLKPKALKPVSQSA